MLVSAPCHGNRSTRWNAAPIRSSRLHRTNGRPAACPTGSPLRVKPAGIASDGQAEIIDRAHELASAAGSRIPRRGCRRCRSRRWWEPRPAPPARCIASTLATAALMRRQRRPAPAHRLEIADARYRKPVLQPHQNLRPVVLRALDQPALVKGGGFDGENQLARRGELALVRQFDLDHIGALAFEDGNRFVEKPRRRRDRGRRHKRRRARRCGGPPIDSRAAAA